MENAKTERNIIPICLKYDKFIEQIQEELDGKIILDFIADKKPIPISIIRQYNKKALYISIIERFPTTTDQPLKDKFNALKNGKTLQFYFQHRNDSDLSNLEDLINQVVKMLNKFYK